MGRSRRHKKMLKKIDNLEATIRWREWHIHKLREDKIELIQEVEKLNKQILTMRSQFNIEKMRLLRGRR